MHCLSVRRCSSRAVPQRLSEMTSDIQKLKPIARALKESMTPPLPSCRSRWLRSLCLMSTSDIKADGYLKRCGDSTKLINRKVEVNRTACIPAGLTRIITLGIWQWCPASISWEADVKS